MKKDKKKIFCRNGRVTNQNCWPIHGATTINVTKETNKRRKIHNGELHRIDRVPRTWYTHSN